MSSQCKGTGRVALSLLEAGLDWNAASLGKALLAGALELWDFAGNRHGLAQIPCSLWFKPCDDNDVSAYIRLWGDNHGSRPKASTSPVYNLITNCSGGHSPPFFLSSNSHIAATMTETGFFPPPHYAPGEHIIFEKPEHTEWTVIAKLSQRNSQKEEVDIQAGLGPSYALATFRVRSDLDGQEAYMRVYLQVPNKGTEFFPPEERAKQAAPSHHLEVEAIKSFYNHGSTITPALLAINEDIQDKQGFVPGGYVIHIVFQRVPGARLADDRLLPGWGAPLHAFFQSFNDLQRHQIRMWFNKEYRKLKELGWVPSFPWASNLIWDAGFSKL